MKALHPYIAFRGTCAEAMAFYRDCLGGELTLQKVSESPMASQMPPPMQDKVMHSTLTLGDLSLMASDMRPPWLDGDSSNVSVMLRIAAARKSCSATSMRWPKAVKYATRRARNSGADTSVRSPISSV